MTMQSLSFADKNGKVDFEEFTDYMASLALIEQTSAIASPPKQEVEEIQFPVPIS